MDDKTRANYGLVLVQIAEGLKRYTLGPDEAADMLLQLAKRIDPYIKHPWGEPWPKVKRGPKPVDEQKCKK